jgi:hypothetical protein
MPAPQSKIVWNSYHYSTLGLVEGQIVLRLDEIQDPGCSKENYKPHAEPVRIVWLSTNG